MSSALSTLEPGIIHVWRGSLDLGQEAYRRFDSLLADDERARAARFHFPRDRARFVVGRGLLRALLGRYLAADPAHLRFRYSIHEKPALVGGGPSFNLAHSGATALFAFSPSFEVGVDVELVRPEFEGDRIAERFFSAVEIEALQALRGVAQTTAATVVCELGSLSRFQNPRQLMAYSGLVPREHSSGGKVNRGAITKTGNAHLRRVLVESAWSYQHRPSAQGRLLRRQKALALDDEVKRISWKAQQRLHKRFTVLSARGKAKGQIVTALARELLGFLWDIARHAEAQFAHSKAA